MYELQLSKVTEPVLPPDVNVIAPELGRPAVDPVQLNVTSVAVIDIEPWVGSTTVALTS